MKTSRIGLLVALALGFTASAHAEQHGAAYAAIEASIDYCKRVDQRHREEYAREGARALASVAALPDDGLYQSVYDAITESLRKRPEGIGRLECAAAIGRHGDEDDVHR